MRSSIYDALEVNSSAPTNAIRAALRGVVRRFWAVPRDASGDSEEAVRFAALAASILIDPMRRKDYDAALNPGVGAGPWRLPISRQPAQDGSTNSRVLGEGSLEPSQLLIEAAPPKALPGVDALAEPLPDGAAWESPLLLVAVAMAGLLLAYALTLRLSEIVPVLSIGQALLVAAGVSALVFAISMWISRTKEPLESVASLSRLAVIKWRREGSIFIGMPPPQHDTAWIFKLRLMELTRSAAGFVTATSAVRRIAARLVDYSMVALFIYFGIFLIDAMVTGFDLLFIVIRSPLLLPAFVVLTAIPVEAGFCRLMRTTPGKWLFGLMPVLGTTRPGDHAAPNDAHLAWMRATSVAWHGAALGFWPLALLRLSRNIRLAGEQETEWDARGDSVLMARPLVAPAVATGLMALLAASLILFAGWRHDYIAVLPQALKASTSAQLAVSETLGFKRTPEPAPGAVISSAPQTVASTATASEDAAAGSVVTPAATAQQSTTPPSGTSSTPPFALPPLSVAESEMSKQASAAAARRARIDGYARQVESARRSGNYAGLQGNCQRWTQEQPGSSDAWRCLGLAQYQNGAGREALPALRQALKLEPNDSQVESAILRILRP